MTISNENANNLNIFEKIIKSQGFLPNSNIKKIPLKILFICSGNICRSAYAEFIFKKLISESEILKGKIIVNSAAVQFRNDSIDERIVSILKEDGIDESISRKHVSRYKDDYLELFYDADIIIGMSKSHKINLPKDIRNNQNSKFVQLAEIAANEMADIEDPFFISDFADFKKIVMKIKDYLIKLKEKLELFFI